ncbi:MAG: hypothetical protein HXS40_13870, partial [Theionarchaea archaeon]|nr:hypothetical protein [Theionarchaea archaeon]
TTVLTMDFLRSYSLGVIVLMPVVFLLVIPYASSKMARGLSRASGTMRSKRDEERTLTEIADDSIKVEDIKISEEEAEEVKAPEVEDEAEVTVDRDKMRLTKAEIIEMLPDELKELMGMDELEKLTKAQLLELLPVDEEDME